MREKVLQRRTEALLTQESVQASKKSPSLNAALLISEMQNETNNRREPRTLVTLDAAKAFDGVWQESLLWKIFLNPLLHRLFLDLDIIFYF